MLPASKWSLAEKSGTPEKEEGKARIWLQAEQKEIGRDGC